MLQELEIPDSGGTHGWALPGVILTLHNPLLFSRGQKIQDVLLKDQLHICFLLLLFLLLLPGPDLGTQEPL